MLLNEDEWAGLIERLIAVTEKRSLDWEVERSEEDESEDSFSYRSIVGETQYTIGSVDGDGVAPFSLDIWRQGAIYDSVQSPSVRSSTEQQIALRSGLRDLYREIGRAVNRAPEQVALFMSDLAILGE
ncbi:hypothetical protein [Curtobacterium sp. MCBA15_001]|uniref:hypothetical protein n=1 Tax=Curtobacterium sp. MCBA15_001 TaxID=1898731 RepID=UPI0008DD25B9|nr:hypothetical protein [Curtobacterium sp. MCBA15_001]OIH92564.1 hypothetical protein BIU90_11920 [Curtobacterium sp. MCBA15_001]